MKIDLWKHFRITLDVKNRIVGGIPANPDLIKPWIEATMKEVSDEARQKIIEATKAELPAVADAKSKMMWTTLKQDEKGVFIEGRQVKSMFKESSNILRDMLVKAEKKAGGEGKSRFTNLKSKVAERLYVEDERIYFERDGKLLSKPDGAEEKPIHVMTAQGERDALKKFDFVSAPARLTINVRILGDGVVDQDLMEMLLEHSSYNGLGADRSQGNGLFVVHEVKELVKEAK